MIWITGLSSVIGGWVILRIFGGERQRQMQDLEIAVLNNARQAK